MSIRTNALGLCFVVVTSCFFASPAVAATVNASSCSAAAVQAAVNAASSGETVLVPAGTCSWTTNVNIPNGKPIKLQGAGVDVTTISSSGQAIAVNLNSTASRVTGFTFNQGRITAGGDDWRIDHNRFIGAGAFHDSVLIQCTDSNPSGRHCRGVVDTNIFENGAVAVPLGFKDTAELHATWARPTALGSADTIFIEDNVFLGPTSFPHYIDTNYGGRFVFRFNTTSNEAAEVHSLQQWRASRAWEVYGNTHNGAGWTAGLIRGGVGVAWGNTVSTEIGPWVLDNVRSWNTGYNYGDCDGTSTADGNTSGQQGWPCRDQIGRGQDVCLSSPSDLTASATGWCAQAYEPSYLFLNRHVGGGIVPVETSGRGRSSALHVLTDRDFFNEAAQFNGSRGVGVGGLANRPATCAAGVAYWATDQGSWNRRQAANTSGQLYKCTATNTWSLYYVPYIYPHPTREEGGVEPPAPTNLTVR